VTLVSKLLVGIKAFVRLFVAVRTVSLHGIVAGSWTAHLVGVFVWDGARLVGHCWHVGLRTPLARGQVNHLVERIVTAIVWLDSPTWVILDPRRALDSLAVTKRTLSGKEHG